jgi:hypothetical protein
MAAGLGFKDFTTGEVLTAADVDGYLMQGVWVFASATARDAAVTSPQEGNFAYLKDTNVTTYYTGSAWANLDTTGMTNPMTTTGDTIYSSSGSTPARLGIGTANQVLRVNSGGTAPEWATPASGALTLLSATTFSGSSAHSVNDVFSATYDNYLLLLNMDSTSGVDGYINFRLRVSGSDNSSNNYYWSFIQNGSSNSAYDGAGSGGAVSSFNIYYAQDADAAATATLELKNPFVSDRTTYNGRSVFLRSDRSFALTNGGGTTVATSYTGFTILTSGGTMTGSIKVYGYVNS